MKYRVFVTTLPADNDTHCERHYAFAGTPHPHFPGAYTRVGPNFKMADYLKPILGEDVTYDPFGYPTRIMQTITREGKASRRNRVGQQFGLRFGQIRVGKVTQIVDVDVPLEARF